MAVAVRFVRQVVRLTIVFGLAAIGLLTYLGRPFVPDTCPPYGRDVPDRKCSGGTAFPREPVRSNDTGVLAHCAPRRRGCGVRRGGAQEHQRERRPKGPRERPGADVLLIA